jgi:hypothetical protein
MVHGATVAGLGRAAGDASWSWDQMLDEFRALGGVAENISRGKGPFGRGIFAANRGRQSRIFVPESLLIDAERIFFENGRLRVKDLHGPAEQFFERYQNAFSWGDGGREDCEEHLATLQSIPAKAAEFVTAHFGRPAPPADDASEWVRRRFLASRQIRYANRKVLMPVLELVNHGQLAKFASKKGLEISGTFEDEVLVRYVDGDPLTLFALYGFSSRERKAYSFSMNIAHDGFNLKIGRQLRNAKKGDRFKMPTVKQEANRIAISHLMIGSARNPRLSRAIFQKLMRGIGIAKVDELFDRIVVTNNQKLFDLLALLEEHDGQGVPILRKAIHYQLEGIAQCVGTLDL